jgi:hypothetical protein
MRMRRRPSPVPFTFVPELLISASGARCLYTRTDLERIRNVVVSRSDVTYFFSERCVIVFFLLTCPTFNPLRAAFMGATMRHYGTNRKVSGSILDITGYFQFT